MVDIASLPTDGVASAPRLSVRRKDVEGVQKRTSRVAMTSSEKLVVFASSLGTVFEWYDFLLVGALAAEISKHFFSGVNPAAAFIFTLLSFAAGFAVRPLGAVVFGRVGDLVGRKYTFLITIVLMGLRRSQSVCCRTLRPSVSQRRSSS